MISKRTHGVRLEAIARSGLRYLSDCPDRKRAVRLVEELLARGLSRSTVSLTVRTLNTIWRIGIERGVVSKSPFERLQVRVPRTLKRALSPQELRAVLSVSNGRTAALVKFLSLTGLRIGAALAIRQEHAQGDMLRVERDKTGGGRVVVLSGRAREALQVFLAFPKIRYEAHQKAIQRAYRDAGILNADAHSLRRTFAQAALETHCDAVLVAHLMGHSSVKLSRAFGQYATMGPSREQQREVVERVSRHLLEGEQQAPQD